MALTIRSAFYPIFGECIRGWTGHIIDTLAVFAKLFGLATSLGFGAQQANTVLEYVYGVSNNVTVQVILIVAITAVALISVLRGVASGVKLLSEINTVIAILLLLFVLVAAAGAQSWQSSGRPSVSISRRSCRFPIRTGARTPDSFSAGRRSAGRGESHSRPS